MHNEIPKEITKFYHCTIRKNMRGIFENAIKKGADGVIYLADSPSNAAKFLYVRGYPLREIVVFEIAREMLDESRLDYSYDHSESFFGCKAYMYQGDIEHGHIENMYEFPNE